MNSTSVDIKNLLDADSGLGLTFATDLFVGREPTSPSNTVTIFDAVGLSTEEALDDEGYDKLSIQIRVRNTSYENGFALATQIKDFLHGRANVTCGNTFYMGIYCISSPILLDWDGNNRCRFIVNFLIIRRV